jgi:hypothetical protein
MALAAWELDDQDDDLAWWAALMAATVADTLPATLLDRLDEMRPWWHRRSACRGSGIDFFSADPGQVEAAAELCSGCPVRTDCGAAGQREPIGTWGGRWRGAPPPRPPRPVPVAPEPPPRTQQPVAPEPPPVCVECGTDELRALGLCPTCYRRHRRRLAGVAERPVGRTVGGCSECVAVGPLTRGLCSACYSRQRRRQVALGA